MQQGKQRRASQRYKDFLIRKFLRVCHYGEVQLQQMVMEVYNYVVALSVVAVLLLIVWKRLFDCEGVMYFIASSMLGLYLVAFEVPTQLIQEKENRMYRELSIYFSRVKHKYRVGRSVVNAIYDASDGLSYEICCHAKELYRLLMESNRKEQVREYVMHSNGNRYMKLFLVQAYEASEKGDIVREDGKSLFIDNVEHLRVDLLDEIYRRRKREYEFAGYSFVAVTPFFFMPVLKQWGLEFAPELEVFYAGIGQVLELLTGLAVFLIYGLIYKAREIELFASEERTRKSEWFSWEWVRRICSQLERYAGSKKIWLRELLLQTGELLSCGELIFKMILFMVMTLGVCFGLGLQVRETKRETLLTSVSTIETIVPLADKEKQELVANHILSIVNEWKDKKELSEEAVRKEVRKRVRLSNTSMEQAVIDEICMKIKMYQSTGMTVAEFVLYVLGSLFAGTIPLLQLLYQRNRMRSGAKEEIRQLQSVVIMERRIKHMTVVNMLEDMEVFSKIFKTVLRSCINTYSSGPERALGRMKEQGIAIQEEFGELADAFLSVDEVGVEKAFEEVEHNRMLLEKMSKLEEDMNLERKRDSMDLIARIPMFLTVGVYFVLPFFTYSLKGVGEVFQLLEELQI